MATAILSTNIFTFKSISKIAAGFIRVMASNPEGSIRQVLETFIKGSIKGN
jgi:predicted Fe-Mo cluster-binding NifX family protein